MRDAIALTGAEGRIGGVLRRLLGETLRPILVPLEEGGFSFADSLRSCRAVVHLAWIDCLGPPGAGSTYLDVLPDDGRHVRNLELTERLLRGALGAGVPRVVLASSVQADDFREFEGPGLLHPARIPRPLGPYGASKVLVEELGRHYGTRGLDVACIRLGAVTADGVPDPADPWERRVHLSHEDCASAIASCLEAPVVPGRFSVFYAVSDNPGRLHDLDNPFGWRPTPRGPGGEADATGAPWEGLVEPGS